MLIADGYPGKQVKTIACYPKPSGSMRPELVPHRPTGGAGKLVPVMPIVLIARVNITPVSRQKLELTNPIRTVFTTLQAICMNGYTIVITAIIRKHLPMVLYGRVVIVRFA